MKVHWDVKDNVINRLIINDTNIIKPWGFETADSSSFFSLQKNVGWRYKTLHEFYNYDDRIYNANLEIKMKEARLELSFDDKIIDNSIYRKVLGACEGDCILMDFVLRYRFKKEFFNYAVINERKIYHRNTNIYYQFPVNEVSLFGDDYEVNIAVINSIVPDHMYPTIYVRDYRDEWIVHIRMLPKSPNKDVVKICKRWAGTRSLPQFLTNILLKNRSLRDKFLYRSEKNPATNNLFLKLFNPNVFPMAKIKHGDRLMWEVKLVVK